MLIRDILIGALRRIGREELARDIENDAEPSGEDADTVSTLMYCINATEDELARYYFPLKCTETLYAKTSKTFNFSDFSHTPVKILSVKSGGERIDFELRTNCLIADARQAEITYCYAPSKKGMYGQSEFGNVGEGRIVELGAASEYCQISGEAALAEVWETRYREAIDRARKTYNVGGYIPPRRWV